MKIKKKNLKKSSARHLKKNLEIVKMMMNLKINSKKNIKLNSKT
jgi:hypothetical protein